MAKNFGFLCILIFFLWVSVEANAFYPRNKINRLPLHVMSLYTPEILRPAVTEEKLYDECGVRSKTAVAKKCRARVMKKFTRVLDIPVFERPTFQSEQFGVIRVKSVPFKPLSFSYISNARGEETEFIPDVVCNFPKSDCVAEHTVLDQKGNWILIPEGPFPSAVWINFFQYTQVQPRIRPLVQLGRLFTIGRSVRATMMPQGKNEFIFSGTEVFIKRIEDGRLVVRMAEAGDKICRPKDKPFGADPQEYAIYLAELYTGKGQLRISPTYPNYCPKSKEGHLPLYKP